jgi:nucleoside-diphosphate-sugar epimerase
MTAETICVVGASGFVGSHVTAALLACGYGVNGTLRDADGPNRDWLLSDVAAAATGENRRALFSADAFDKGSFAPAMEGCAPHPRFRAGRCVKRRLGQDQ